MESSEEKVTSAVKSPGKIGNLRNGRGFSLKEIKESGKTIQLLKQLGITIDYRRQSSYKSNIDALKQLKAPKEKKTAKKKREWIPKEQRMKPKKVKKKVPAKKIPKKAPKKKAVEKAKPEQVETVKEEPKKVASKKLTKAVERPIDQPTTDKVPLTELSGLGATTAKKFEELGIDSVQELIKEKPEELAMLVKGCSEDRIQKWIDEGKELIE